MKEWEKIYLKQVEKRLTELINGKKTIFHFLAIKKRLTNEDLAFLYENLGEEGSIKFLMEEGFYYDYKRKEIKRKSRARP